MKSDWCQIYGEGAWGQDSLWILLENIQRKGGDSIFCSHETEENKLGKQGRKKTRD